MKSARRDRKDPLKHSPLPNPGDSLTKQFDDLFVDKVLLWITMGAFGISLAIMEWISWIFESPRRPFLMTIFAMILVAIAVWRIWRIRPLLMGIKLGIRGERAVGQYLERMRVLGYVVIHDLVERDADGTEFNIDHILIGPAGVFTVDTKTRTKPASGTPLIEYSGTTLRIDGGPPDEAPIIQALAAANRIRQIIEEMTGRPNVPIQPIVAFPGWFIKGQQSTASVWVLEPKAIPKWIAYGTNRLPEEDVALFSNRISIRAREG